MKAERNGKWGGMEGTDERKVEIIDMLVGMEGWKKME